MREMAQVVTEVHSIALKNDETYFLSDPSLQYIPVTMTTPPTLPLTVREAVVKPIMGKELGRGARRFIAGALAGGSMYHAG